MINRIRTMNPWQASGTITGPWSPALGVARSILALATLMTLLFNDPDLLFRPLGVATMDVGSAAPIARLSLFSLIGNLEVARWTAVALLAIVVTGWRPRITGLLHWWVAFSFAASAVVIDGGDQVAVVLTLLLVPMTLLDPRKWSWQPMELENANGLRVFAARSALVMIKLQVAVIYLAAAIGKFGVTEWVNGTALYYWLEHPVFGISGMRAAMLDPIISSSLGVVALTWSVLLLELLLSVAILGPPKLQRVVFAAGVLFHAGIIVLHGLASFGTCMIAALILYLRAPLSSRQERIAAEAEPLAPSVEPQRMVA